jgi:chromosome segregation ATPase
MTLLEEELNDRLTQIQTQDIEINRLNEELSAAIKGGPIGDAPAALQPGPEDQEISRLTALLNEVDGGKAGGPGLKGLSDQDRARIAELEDALRDRDAKIAHIGKEIDSMRGAITAGEKALKEKEAELASVRDRSGDSGAKITALEKELSAVKASLDKEKEAAVKSVTSELDKIKTEYEKVKAGAEELKAQLEKKDKEAKQLSEELAKEKSERSGKEVDKEEDILKLKRELEGAREETEKLKKQLQERFSDIEKKDKEIADLKESLVSHQESGKTKGKALESSLEELNKELQASKTEVQRLSGELNKKFQDIIFRENELAAVKADLEKEKAKSPAGGASLIANASMKSEMDNIKAELAKYKKAIDEKEAELQAIKGQAAQAPAGGSTVTAEFSALAKMVEEEKTVASDIRTYLDENKSKLEMLMDKAKENVDLIAQFSKTKDFEEFRKTLHMDNIIMKYENEIDFLKRKNLDLELKLKARQ